MSILSRPEFHDEQAAYDYVEARIWPHGATCPKCGERERVGKMGGKSTRIGAYKCYKCRKPFTVKVGTIFESSHVKMNLWLQAIYLMCASKKGISSNQLHRTLGVTLKTAWFMSHRIREAMRDDTLAGFGAGGGVVEVDETFIGVDRTVKPKHEKKGRGYAHKHKVLSLVDRTTGRAKSMVVDDLKTATLLPILLENIAKEAVIYTDEAGQYKHLHRSFAAHDFVRHGVGEYGRGEIHTNTIEGYFSIFKRGMKGVYQHCAKKHLHRYAAEFEFRYNNRIALGADDRVRADLALISAAGKRLTYQ
ncbi:MAG: IS1595 family transposase [Alphaproteobacteria bacterium]|nr:MAG: IS1595 family transposase [Alphaproteobacteria bacterium]